MATSATETAWIGVLLAGGRSSRMGCDKARLKWRGQSLLSHMQALLRAAGADRVLVSGQYPEAHAIADQQPGLGPLGGIASVAEALPDTRVIVVPIDMPLLQASSLQVLANQTARCCAYQGHMLPLLLRLDADVRQTLQRLLNTSHPARSLHALHAALDGTWLPMHDADAQAFANANTPEQWQALQT